MHQKNKSELHQIRKKESTAPLPDSNSQPPAVFLLPIHQKHLQIHTQNQNHLKIQIPSQSSLSTPPHPSSTPTHPNSNQTQIQNEPICNYPSMNKTLLSSPQKRRIMSQIPSTSSLMNDHNGTVLNSEPSKLSVLCFSSISVIALATKPILLRLSRYLCCVRWVGLHFRFIILLSLPTLYFFTSNLSNYYSLYLLSILAFFVTLVISLNLALPRLRSTNLSSKNTASNPSPPVVWSIGSKPEPIQRLHSGNGVKFYSNGDVYEGEFHKGKCSGSGVYYYYMSGRYEGDWVGDKYDGFGVETWAKGSRYRGQYQQGLRHGFGVYRFYTGDVYAGEWCNGQCHGRGVYTCQDGSRYIGEFKWGVKHGLGHYHFRNGDKYAGEYFADKTHGFGVYCFGNGHCYEGAWHEGRRQGLGMYTFRNGDTQSGHWQNGVLNVPSTQDNLPETSLAISHSKVLIAVQESRQASMKAVNIANVDERVNKAVAAANKAANAARVAAVKAVQNQMHHDNCNSDFPMQIV